MRTLLSTSLIAAVLIAGIGIGAAEAGSGSHSGVIKETMNSGGYTYALLDKGDSEVWVAGPMTELAIGDKVTTGAGAEMRNYTSPTLERTFAVIYFVVSINADGAATSSGALPPGHPSVSGMGSPAGVGKGAPNTGVVEIDPSKIAKPEGGYRVSEVYEQRDKLADQEILVRGQVVKFTPMIMGTNWIHIQDGTGDEETNDLTVTTSSTVKFGETILVKGKLSVNKDFGYGYNYLVIVESAEVTSE